MNVTYKIYGKSASEEQALVSPSYEKVYSNDLGIKRIEKFRESILSSLTYSLDDGENEGDLLTSFMEISSIVVFVDRKLPLGLLFMQNSRWYNGSGIISRYRTLYSPDGLLICDQALNVSDLSPMYEYTTKYFNITGSSFLEPDFESYRYIINFRDENLIESIFPEVNGEEWDRPIRQNEFLNEINEFSSDINTDYFLHARFFID